MCRLQQKPGSCTTARRPLGPRHTGPCGRPWPPTRSRLSLPLTQRAAPLFWRPFPAFLARLIPATARPAHASGDGGPWSHRDTRATLLLGRMWGAGPSACGVRVPRLLPARTLTPPSPRAACGQGAGQPGAGGRLVTHGSEAPSGSHPQAPWCLCSPKVRPALQVTPADPQGILPAASRGTTRVTRLCRGGGTVARPSQLALSPDRRHRTHRHSPGAEDCPGAEACAAAGKLQADAEAAGGDCPGTVRPARSSGERPVWNWRYRGTGVDQGTSPRTHPAARTASPWATPLL